MPEFVPVDHDPFAEESPGGQPNAVMDVAVSFPRGVAKGAGGLADTAAAGFKRGNPTNPVFGAPASEFSADDDFPFAPAPEHIQQTLEELSGKKLGEPKTTAGRYAESVGEMVPSAMLGPESLLAKGATALGAGLLGQAGEDVAGAPGRFAGSVLGGGIGGGVTAAKTPRPDFQETFDAFERLGLKPTAATTDVGGKATKWLEANVLPQAIGSANRMQKTIEGNLTQFTRKQQEIASSFGAPKTKADMGADLQDTVLSGWQGRKDEAGKIFNAIGQAFGPNDKFAPSNLLGVLNKPLGSASSKEVKAFTDAPELQELDQLLTQTGGKLSYSDMTALKSKFGDMLDPRYSKDINKAQIGQIVHALDEDIEGAVKSLGNKDTLRDWQYAKATYSNAMQDYQQAFKKLLGTRELPVRAERVYDILVGQAGIKSPADMESFRKVWGQLGKAKQGDLSATVLSHMGNKDPSKLGDMEGFSLPTFLTNYKNLSPDAKEMLFRQTGNTALEKSFDDLMLAAQKMGVWPALESTSKSGTFAGMASQAAAPLAYAAAGQYAASAKAAILGIGGPAIAAKVLTDPRYVKRLAYAMDNVNAGLTGATKAVLGVAAQ